MRHSFVRGSIALAAMLAASRVSAQTGTGAITGVVNDANRRPLSGAIVQVQEYRLGGYADNEGRYRIDHIPVGTVRVVARIPGFVSDTVSLTVAVNQTVTKDFVLRPTSVTLQTVTVTSPRLNETKAAALQEQKTADNIVSVMSGDEIRSLPNANAAEAAARIPGVTTERDEGEGKFVEIRGTPPTFQNVQIDGVHVPGTLSGDRSVKLDDVPSDLLGAIEVTKTLTADQEANAIGGTINLVSKIPEGAPRGYVAAQYAYQSLENNSNGQGSATYGGRLGDRQQFGFLLGGSYDRTNRVIQDVEPFYVADFVTPQGQIYQVPNGPGFNHYFPGGWSEREYDYYRTRYGLDGNLDYRPSPTSDIYLRGLWSAFFDQANVWHTEVNGNTQPGGDQFKNGVFQDSGASVTPNTSNRGPIEHTWGGVLGARNLLGPVHLDYEATYAGSSATSHNSYFDTYNPTAASVSNFTYTYTANRLLPRFFPTNGSTLASIPNGQNYVLNGVNTSNGATNGVNLGGAANALIPYSLGNLPASFKLGVKYYDEHKSNDPGNFQNYSYTGGSTLQQFASPYTVSNFYGHICSGCYPQAPFGSIPAGQNALTAQRGNFQLANTPDQILFSNLTNTWSGTEQVSAAYGMQTLDIDQLHINVGLRAENTAVGYFAYNQDINGDQTSASLLHTHVHHSYTDLFPSVNLRLGLDENTNVRFAFTRGIARPNYGDLVPTFTFFGTTRNSQSNGLSAGNPSLQPERAWNYDFLAEHYFPSVGVLSGGLFYKQISNFIFNRTTRYTGQFIREAQYLPNDSGSFYITQRENGPSAWLYGFEADYTQHMTFLPGALRGIGFDVNWTWVTSRATVPIQNADSTNYITAAGDTVFPYRGKATRHAPIPRQFPNLFNASLLYDYGPVSARLTGQYTAASVYSYGADGSSNPSSADVWNYPHWQIDGSLVVTVYGATALQAQVLNLNNATFGFFQGNGLPGSGHGYNIQREFYGTTLYIGVRQGL
jgi:TonB-dependent receptor